MHNLTEMLRKSNPEDPYNLAVKQQLSHCGSQFIGLTFCKILLAFCWKIYILDTDARVVRGEALLESVPWLAMVKQM